MVMPTSRGWQSKTLKISCVDKMSGTAHRRFQTLAISGGGYRGLFTAKLIASCEKEFQSKCVDRFDLIAGTSIGALLAAAVPAAKLASIMEGYGPKIFRRNLFTGAKRFLLAAPCSSGPILEAFRKALGENIANLLLCQFEAPLVITTVNYSTGHTRVFRPCCGAFLQCVKQFKLDAAIRILSRIKGQMQTFREIGMRLGQEFPSVATCAEAKG